MIFTSGDEAGSYIYSLFGKRTMNLLLYEVVRSNGEIHEITAVSIKMNLEILWRKCIQE